MAKPLKTVGLTELHYVVSRAKRQYALGRISREDEEYLLARLREVEARIISMDEDLGEDEPLW